MHRPANILLIADRRQHSHRCIAAPLNPAYLASEVEFYLSDTQAKLLLVHKGAIAENSEAVKAATKLNIPVAEVSWNANTSSVSFSLAQSASKRSSSKHGIEGSGQPKEDDVALLLHVRSISTSKVRADI